MRFIANFEEILASVAISITVLVVIINVFLRYVFGFVVPWSEELSVICFIGAVYFGISSCYKHKLHMGVDVIMLMLPENMQKSFRIILYSFLLAFNLAMAYLSLDYTLLSKKVTPVMGISYAPINSVVFICFFMMSIHSIKFIYQEAITLKHQSKY
ncbi:2,3-diketo-L-gulonate TRAP transporter small permease protein YiaM [Vibrio thalassae]|uniref:TRAP transporter small permease protein n=1 Tax=Vibrio thalassae TaxID=1243014 RepID=A0A240ENS0_9VIBR|nr:TRAP transporter small permease [Vibrio thalassae]SNX50266.1 2,3-diketo-L-gulonate TRAP transporter small permease protein YiaM [Vibrio thalassae]